MRLFFIAIVLFGYILAFAEEVWVEKLNGITFASSQEVLEQAPKPLYDINFLDLYIPDQKELFDLAYSFLGKPVTASLLREMKKAVVEYYRDHGYPIVGAVIPVDQDITEGNIQMIVVLGKVGDISAKGAKWFSNDMIKKEFSLKKGDVISYDDILCELDWINRNPFYTTNAIFEPGKHLSETDVVLMTDDKFPFRAYGGYENTGNLIAGATRYMGGINWGNVLGRRDLFNALYMTSPHNSRWWSVTGSYTLFMPRRTIFELYGAFTRTKPKTDDNIESEGKGWQIAWRCNFPFCTGRFHNNLFFGYEFKRTNNFLVFGEGLVFENFFDISQFVVGMDSKVEYDMGVTSMGVIGFISPGKMTPFNFDKYVSTERNGVTANYVYANLYLNQTVKLMRGWGWLLNLQYQWASGKILPSEEFSLGGFFTVRGYDENEVIGDNGLLLKNELRSKKMVFQPNKGPAHNFQFLGFCDFGLAYDTDKNIVLEDVKVLASVGPGIRYNYGTLATFRFDYGYQIITIQREINNSTKNARAHLSLIVGF